MPGVSICVVGAVGRMGLEIICAAEGNSDIRIVGAVDSAQSPHIGDDAGELAGVGPLGVAVTDDLMGALEIADVAIDLSVAEATEAVVAAARKCKVPLVCGTTGIDAAAKKAIESAGIEIPVIYTPNLSLGIAVTKQLLDLAVRVLGPDFDVEIVEMHHGAKVDAPSGTALALAQTAAEGRGVRLEVEGRFGRHGRTGARTDSEIGVHALRGGGVFGWHQIILAGKHETIEISHRATSRALFAEGALRTAIFLRERTPGVYTMDDVVARPFVS